MNYPKGIINSNEPTGVVVLDERKIVTPGYRGNLEVRTIGNFKGKGYYLDPGYEWQILEDDTGCLVLVCTRK